MWGSLPVRRSVVATVLFVVAIALTPGQSFTVQAVTCSSASDCNAQIQSVQRQIQSAAQGQQQAQQEAQQAQQEAQQIGQSLASTNQQIRSTQDQIGDVTSAISEKERVIAETEAQLVREKEHQNHAIQTLYEMGGSDPLQIALASENISDIFQQSQYISSIERQVQAVIDQVNKTQVTLQQQREDLENQKDKLNELKSRQQVQASNLAAQQQEAKSEQASAAAEADWYAQQKAEAQAKLIKLQQQLSTLTSTARWGGDIISDAPANWSYIQLNYSQTLGDSPYTIHDYGCLVSSLAMVATYYGNSTTPPWIASHDNWFTRGGDAYTSSIADGIGITISKSGVNWNTVDRELDNGRPVIISIYLPQVGALNSDGSSHFVVLSGKSGKHYLMQDPLGSGRGYSLGQVRSMITTRAQ